MLLWHRSIRNVASESHIYIFHHQHVMDDTASQSMKSTRVVSNVHAIMWQEHCMLPVRGGPDFRLLHWQ